ncbi:MAG: copper amine oxidase N-terminal domain-containing protein [Peptococcaceae bacterium]|nr:copper amine oxidase N-terminal domain-containing protein [Peptococcaceae bacterium]
MKKWRALFLGGVLGLLFTAVPAWAYGPYVAVDGLLFEMGAPVTVHADGEYVATDVQPYIKNGRTFLPMRAAAEAVGANVGWDGKTLCVTVQKGETLAYFFVGSRTYYVNDVALTASVAPENKDGRIMVPIRDFSEAVQATVDWEGSTASVEIYTGGPVAEAPQLPSSIPDDVRWLIQKYYVQADGQGAGSWMTSDLENSALPEYNRLPGYEFVLISKMANGTKAATVIRYEHQPFIDGITQIGVKVFADCKIDRLLGETLIEPEYQPTYYFGLPIEFQVKTIRHFVPSAQNLRLVGTATDSFTGPQIGKYPLPVTPCDVLYTAL